MESAAAIVQVDRALLTDIGDYQIQIAVIIGIHCHDALGAIQARTKSLPVIERGITCEGSSRPEHQTSGNDRQTKQKTH